MGGPFGAVVIGAVEAAGDGCGADTGVGGATAVDGSAFVGGDDTACGDGGCCAVVGCGADSEGGEATAGDCSSFTGGDTDCGDCGCCAVAKPEPTYVAKATSTTNDRFIFPSGNSSSRLCTMIETSARDKSKLFCGIGARV
jgi:hypothetical protein